jgi:hypothetical protein
MPPAISKGSAEGLLRQPTLVGLPHGSEGRLKELLSNLVGCGEAIVQIEDQGFGHAH